MAEIVLGVGSSHSPMLSLSPEYWPRMGEGDKRNRMLAAPPDGNVYTYEELVERTDPAIVQRLTPENFTAQYQACQQAISTLQQALVKASPDVVLIVSDDQEEVYFEDNMPAFSIYWGDSAPLVPISLPESAPHFMKLAAWGWGDVEMDVPVASNLARHLVQSLVDNGFDMAHSRYWKEEYGGRVGPSGYIDYPTITSNRRQGLPHGYAFVVRRIMTHHQVPIIPLVQNTFYPPNVPPPGRCYSLGQALRQAIEDWPADTRVAIVASGGLSHQVVDEEVDQMAIRGLTEKNADLLQSLPRNRLRSGTSEILNWVTAAGALEPFHMEMVDYVPVYRSPAGTGGGWAFALWS